MAKVLHARALRNNGADYDRPYLQIKVDPETTLEDVLRPGFWAHHAQTLKVDSLIDILSEDGGMDVQVRVVGKGVGMVHVRPLRVWVRKEEADAAGEPELTDVDIPEGYTVSFAPTQRWRAMTNEPHMIISKNNMSKSDAIRAAIEHAQKAQGIAA
ncbi:MAG: hypothetical protein EOR57_31550 [Mesorhizobium sp.]|uniref:hypothetical protein n=1 Tax=Mesorhizobium sp. TaxID=1871066 RepID=UPI000FE59A70|nr:hypothetical protein [Mesorhizobium sp.]RWL14883.1 MAG: hypothetical protein EOR57_31550 [Mesorhizobium sp.]